MEGHSKPILNSLDPNISSTILSPGNNPFDDVWKKTLDAISASEQISRRSSIRLTTDFINNSGRKSLSFCDLNASDFGRESMGILPPDLGKDSLSFLNISNLETDLESLAITQINAFRESLSFKRESLGILNFQDRDSVDYGRESLGILHLKSPDVKFGDEEKRVPDIMLTTIAENSIDPCNILDTAFLQPHSRKSSTLSSTSSVNPSFNSLSLEGPSRIYSASSIKNYNIKLNTNGDIGNTYCSSCVSDNSLNKGMMFSPTELKIRSRIQSEPTNAQKYFSSNNTNEANNENKFWSVDRPRHSKILEKSFHDVSYFKEADISNEFLDSVFIEGHMLAEKIADGSILNESSVGEIGILDSTPQPDWPSDISYNDQDNAGQKCDTETIFKTVDKMLPPPVKDMLSSKLKTSKTDSNSSNENSKKINTSEKNSSKSSQTGEKSVCRLFNNVSDIQHETKSRKDPREILENLSEILNCSNPSDKQKSAGKSLLNSLADILCESKSKTRSQDDSGHSSNNEQSDSSNKENHGYFEVLDLRMKSTDGHTSNENFSGKSEVLDLSLKSKTTENFTNKRLSQSCSSSNVKIMSQTEKKNSSVSSLDMNKNKTSNTITSNDSKNISDLVKPQISGKLRQKHFTYNTKRGPMKAVIPVGDMKKKDSTSGTPERNQETTTIHSKRTSTPINEPKLKPMAASTPTTQSTGTPRSCKNQRTAPVKNNVDSSLTKRKSVLGSNFTRSKAYSSTCLPKSSVANVESRLRTNSMSDVKKPNEVLRRRNSVDTESGAVSSIARVRQSLGSPYFQSRKPISGVQIKSVSENRGKLAENKHLPAAKSVISDSKFKLSNKVVPIKLNESTSAAESSLNVLSPHLSKNIISKSSDRTSKTGLRYERRNSINEMKKNKESKVKLTRSKSIANDSGVMSSLAKVRQNMLKSPYFHLKKEDLLNKNYILSENRGMSRTDIGEYCYMKNTGKENIEK